MDEDAKEEKPTVGNNTHEEVKTLAKNITSNSTSTKKDDDMDSDEPEPKVTKLSLAKNNTKEEELPSENKNSTEFNNATKMEEEEIDNEEHKNSTLESKGWFDHDFEHIKNDTKTSLAKN
jgi:hypothetical protein